MAQMIFRAIAIVVLTLASAAMAEGLKPAPDIWFNRYCAHYGEIDMSIVDYTAAVRPQILQAGYFGPEWYSAQAYARGQSVPHLWTSLGGGPVDPAWLRELIEKEHAQGVKIVGMFSLSLVFGDHEKTLGWFDYWDNRWDAALLGPRPTLPDGTAVKAVDMLQRDKSGYWRRTDYAIEGGAEYMVCPNHPAYREALRRMVKVGIDLGLDGYNIIFPKREDCVCDFCQAAFRKHLASRYSADEIKTKFGIADLAAHRFERINGWYEPDEASPLALEALKFSQLVLSDLKREVFLDYGRSLKPDLIVGQWNHIYRSSMSGQGQTPGSFAQLNADEQCALPTDRWSRGENFVWYSIGNWRFGNEAWDPANGRWGQFSVEHKYLREAGRGLPQAVKRDDRDNVRLYIAEAVAHGGFGYARGPDYRDAATREHVKRYFDFLREHEDFYRDIESHAPVALVFPRAAVHRGDTSAIADFKHLGRLLTDRHVLFDVVVDEQFSEDRRKRYAVVIEAKSGGLTGESDAAVANALVFRAVAATPEVVVVAWRQPEKKRLLLHLVNYKREPIETHPGDHPLPQRDLKASVPLPEGVAVQSVKLLSPDSPRKEVAFTQQDGRLNLTVPELLVYTVVVAELR